MGNSNSFMEKVYIYLPIVMFHSRMNYNDPNTMTTMRVAYFAEQVRRQNFGTWVRQLPFAIAFGRGEG